LPPRDRALRRFESTGFHPAVLRRGWLSTLGPRSRPAFLSTQDASSSQTKPFDFCNEFSIRRTDAFLRARSSPAAGDCPACVAARRCAFGAAGPLLRSWEEKSDPTCRSELRAIPRRPGSRPRPLQPKPEPLRTAPFERARRTWDARRPNELEPRQGRCLPLRAAAPSQACAWRSLLGARSSPSCRRRCVRDGMEARSRAATRPHCRPRPPFRLAPAKVRAFPWTEVLSTVGTGRRKGSLPESPGRSCAVRGRRPGSAPYSGHAFVTGGPRLGLTTPSGAYLRLDHLVGDFRPPPSVAAPLTASTIVGSRN
jgi:hypothetical protein